MDSTVEMDVQFDKIDGSKNDLKTSSLNNNPNLTDQTETKIVNSEFFDKILMDDHSVNNNSKPNSSPSSPKNSLNEDSRVESNKEIDNCEELNLNDDKDIQTVIDQQINNQSTNELQKNNLELENNDELNINKSENDKTIDESNKTKPQKPEYNNPKYETVRMKDYLRRAVKATSQYNKLINQERKDERRICLDLQTYTLHYPLGLGAENRMLKRNIETGKCKEKSKYPIAVLPGHYQNNYRKYTSEELKYFPLNTVIYGPVVTDTDKLPPLLTRIEEDSFSDSESSLSTDHSCCCDENTCKKLKLENGSASNPNQCNCIEELSSSSEDEEIDDEQPPKLTNIFHYTNRENAVCDVCKKNSLIKLDGLTEKLIHCTDCILSFHPTCLDMTPEMIKQIQLYPWECSNCKRCTICSESYETNMLICDLCDKASHAICVGLKGIPLGKWYCRVCSVKQKFIKR